MHFDVVVIGAGLSGACTALALSAEGFKVGVVERDARPMNRASLRNEGKIHLGLIYALDRPTAAQQLAGALCFRRLLRQWAGPRADAIGIAAPFTYLVSRDSIVSPDDLSEHYDWLEAQHRDALREDPRADYLGRRPDRLAWRQPDGEAARFFDPARFAAAFGTAELAIDTFDLAAVMSEALARAPGVTLLAGRRVRVAERRHGGFRLSGDGDHGPWSVQAGQVVNASWDGLYALDRQVGLEPAPGWLHRLKYRVLVRLPEPLLEAPSATIVLGAFGDVVVRPNGLSYLSWYPSGLQGWTDDIAPPDAWDAPARGRPDPALASRIRDEILSGLDAWMPGIAGAETVLVDAGPILAHGRTDVDDPGSGLHGRVTGVTSLEGWHSLSPGKLTTAPYHARSALDAVMSEAGPAAIRVAAQ